MKIWLTSKISVLAVLMAATPSCTDPTTPVVDDDEGSAGDSTGDGSAEEPSSDGMVAEPRCGDGIVDEGEACDDAGPSATCDADCTPAECGDAVLNTEAGETCDAGGASPECDDDCTPAECGDGVLNPMAAEECDETELGGLDCEAAGFDGGELACLDTCTVDTAGCGFAPGDPGLELNFSAIKRFDFSWPAIADADYVQLEQRLSPTEAFAPLAEPASGTSISIEMPLHLRSRAGYRLQACNTWGCNPSAVTDVNSSLAEAVGYVKASNTGAEDEFGDHVALSADGNTLAVGARLEQSGGTGVDANPLDDSTDDAGAVYVYTRDPATGQWSAPAYIKASNTGLGDGFGERVALSADGNTLAVAAGHEDGDAPGVNGNEDSGALASAGAVYVYTRDPATMQWSQEAYVKASNPGWLNYFGFGMALSQDGDTLAVGAPFEDGASTGIDGDDTDLSSSASGAVYVYTRSDSTWSLQAYVKASNNGSSDYFGNSVALSADGDTMAVGAYYEDGGAVGIDGDQQDDSAENAGAVYVFGRDGAAWSQHAYVKASDTNEDEHFGHAVSLSGDGHTLAVSAPELNAETVYLYTRDPATQQWAHQADIEPPPAASYGAFGYGLALSSDGQTLAAGAYLDDGASMGLDGDPRDDSAIDAGAVYVYGFDATTEQWLERSYVKASNTDSLDDFGRSVALTGDGHTLAVGAPFEQSAAIGVGGAQSDDSAYHAGAVYLY